MQELDTPTFRLAVAPTEYGGRTDYRYVRVCPDRRGRYRITS